MSVLYLLPWALWVAAFFVLEGIGFRKGHDRWPTLSELVKRWEGENPTEIPWEGDQTITVVTPVEYGFATWTWRRWLVAIGLPILGVLLEAHWVLEVF